MKSTLASYFEKIYGKPAEVFAQAPGRIEFIGNHTDYNGGFTMGVAIDKIVMAALAKRDDDKLCFASIRTGEKVYVDINDIKKQNKEHNWVNYPLGVFKYLLEAGMTANSGFDMLDMSSVPPGAGLSSSAAIELSSGYAMSALYGFDVDKKTLVRIGRQSENLFVGMPCGILDQGVSTSRFRTNADSGCSTPRKSMHSLTASMPKGMQNAWKPQKFCPRAEKCGCFATSQSPTSKRLNRK